MTLSRGKEILNPWDPEWEQPSVGEAEDAVLRAVREGFVMRDDMRRAELAFPADREPSAFDLFHFWRERGVLRARLK